MAEDHEAATVSGAQGRGTLGRAHGLDDEPAIEVGDQLWFYYGGTSYHHDWWLGRRAGRHRPPETVDPIGCGAEFGLGLATLRKDGFAGLYANHIDRASLSPGR